MRRGLMNVLWNFAHSGRLELMPAASCQFGSHQGPLQTWLASTCTPARAFCHHTTCFAAALPSEREDKEEDQSWLTVDPPFHKSIDYQPRPEADAACLNKHTDLASDIQNLFTSSDPHTLSNPDSMSSNSSNTHSDSHKPSHGGNSNRQHSDREASQANEGMTSKEASTNSTLDKDNNNKDARSEENNVHISLEQLQQAVNLQPSSDKWQGETSVRQHQHGDENDEDHEDWSEDEARDYAPIDAWQKKHSPHGEPPKRRWPREKKRKGIGPPEMKAKLAKFDDMVPRLQAYKDKFGDCLVPKRYWEDYQLGAWTSRIRSMLKDKLIKVQHFDTLDAMSFPWAVPVEVAEWETYFHELRRYKEEFGNTEIPFKWKDPVADFSNHFARWFHQQPTLFLQRRLRPDQVRKLMLAGIDLREVTGDYISKEDYIAAQSEVAVSGDKNEFEIMFAEFEAWKATYFTTVIPRYVWDNPVLGAWAWKIRKDQRNNKLAQWKIDRLEKLEILWKVDQITAKWHANLHEARRYKEAHGTANIPLEYRNNDEPGWMEAAQWLDRQAKLFRKEKLTDKRYRIIREVLGIKFVRQYAPRVKENRERRGIWDAPGKKLPKYAPPVKKNIAI